MLVLRFTVKLYEGNRQHLLIGMIQSRKIIINSTGADTCAGSELMQRLWEGYGTIARYKLQGGSHSSIIAKHILPRKTKHHGLSGPALRSHRRKRRSYEVERYWYQHQGVLCGAECRVPQCIAIHVEDDECVILLEDLDAVGFPKRKHHLSREEMNPCLRWLAHFHSTFLGAQPTGLWPQGTYWHLETRPDELEVLQDKALKSAAAAIDQKLRSAKYQTIVHGDAKLENFCFSEDGHSVAAVDFQYVGGGCGVQDVAYFISSCCDEKDCKRYAEDCLEYYLSKLRSLILQTSHAADADAVCGEWRDLFPFAWVDFHRFYKGWSPGHWDRDSYSETLTREVIALLKQ